MKNNMITKLLFPNEVFFSKMYQKELTNQEWIELERYRIENETFKPCKIDYKNGKIYLAYQ